MVTEKGPKWGWFARDEQEEGRCGRHRAREVSPALQARTRVRCLEFGYNNLDLKLTAATTRQILNVESGKAERWKKPDFLTL